MSDTTTAAPPGATAVNPPASGHGGATGASSGPPPTLSPQTEACVQGLVRAKADVEAWTKNLKQALTDDVNGGRLTADQASQVATKAGVTDFKPPTPSAPDQGVPTLPEGTETMIRQEAKKAEATAKQEDEIWKHAQEQAADAAHKQSQSVSDAHQTADAQAQASQNETGGRHRR